MIYLLSSLFFFNLSISFTQLERLLLAASVKIWKVKKKNLKSDSQQRNLVSTLLYYWGGTYYVCLPKGSHISLKIIIQLWCLATHYRKERTTMIQPRQLNFKIDVSVEINAFTILILLPLLEQWSWLPFHALEVSRMISNLPEKHF